MRIFKIILKVFTILLLLVSIGIFFYWQHLKPTYKGNLKLSNLKEPVTVYYDNIGVPHIYANNQEDAYIAFGYAHAQDRLWQMELIRRISAGRLSEVLGEDLVPVDKFYLGLGITDAAKKTIANLDTNATSYKLAAAYLDGINQFIENGPTPIEYKLANFKKEKFTILDIYNVFGYMSFSFANAHKTDPLMSSLKEKLDYAYLEELDLKIDSTAVTIPVYNKGEDIASSFVASVLKIMEKSPVPAFIGSNAWVIAPEKTAKGKVIFVNDPHIAYSQPSVWYQSHIVCPEFEIYGFNLALTPFPLLGHNRQFAYGLTMFENDDIDFYEEEENVDNKNEYLTQNGFIPYEIREEVIKVKGKSDINLKIKVSKHGPIMNDFLDEITTSKPIAMDWIYTKFDNKMLTASYEMSHATSLDSFKQAVAKIHAPGLNVMYGDAQDNIAWFAAGKLYNHINNVNPNFILNGANGEDDQVEYYDFEDNPQAINPPWNYVYSANNQPGKTKNGYYPGYYLPKNRAKRITDVLNNLTNISTTDMKDLVTDVTSSVVPDLLKIVTKQIDKTNLTSNEKSAISILRSWKGDFELNQVAPTIFTMFKYHFLKNTFRDELGEIGFKQFLETTLVKRQFNIQIERANSIWNDNINTDTILETKSVIITQSFKETIAFLEKQHGNLISNWTWNKVHTVEHEHPIGKNVPLLRKYFNVGPFPINGTNEVLNNQIFNYNKNGIYKVTAGPSTRRIVDFNDVENSIAIIPTGQSGNVFSKHYKNQAQKFVNGEFIKMLINKTEIEQLEDKLVINPK